MSGKLCTHCKSVYTGDVCSNCGKDSGKKMWLTENEYSSYISELATAAGVSSEKAETGNVDSDNQVTDTSEPLQNEEGVADITDTAEEVTDVADDTVAGNVEEPISTDNDVLTDDACETPAQPESVTEEAVNPEPVEPVAEKIEKPQETELEKNKKQDNKPKKAENIKAETEKKPSKTVASDKKHSSSKVSVSRKKRKNKTWIPAVLAIIFVGAVIFALYYYIYLPGHPTDADVNVDSASGVQSDAAIVENLFDYVIDSAITSDASADSDAEVTDSATGIEFAEFEYMNRFLGVSHDGEKQVDTTNPAAVAYAKASDNLMNGRYYDAYSGFRSLGTYSNSRTRLTQISMQLSRYIGAGYNNIVGLTRKGVTFATGNNDSGKIDIGHWSDVTSISTRGLHTVGVCYDGTVVAVGSNDCGQCNVDKWYSVMDAKAGSRHTLGLMASGKVVSAGDNSSGQCDVKSWENIKAIAAGSNHSVALCKDGTVVAVGDNQYGQCNVTEWTDIIQISAGDWYTVGLKKDGTIVSTGSNNLGQRNLSDWKDIVYISAGLGHTVGLKADGTVVATGCNTYGECNLSDWNNIASVVAGGKNFTVAITTDGKVLVAGSNDEGQYAAVSWAGVGA